MYRWIERLFQELGEFVSPVDKHIEEGAWFREWTHIGCIAFDEEQAEEEQSEQDP